MKIGAYTAVLHDRSLADALDVLQSLGLNGAEINSGGFLPPVHLPTTEIMESDVARDEYLAQFTSREIKITALNCNGNPLHPDPEVGKRHGKDVFDAISTASRLGVKRVITMSGLPAAHAGGLRPAWAVNPWNSVDLDTLEYQWQEVAIPYWKKVNTFAAEHDVTVSLEMHPQNVVFNPPTMLRLIEQVNATHIGAEMDPSHLFWQQIDPIAALEYLSGFVFTAAAKDVRINPAVRLYGVLDDRFTRVPQLKTRSPSEVSTP